MVRLQVLHPRRRPDRSALVVVENNSLILRRRRTNGRTSPVDEVIATGIQREAGKTIIMRFEVSRSNQGEREVWYATDEADPVRL